MFNTVFSVALWMGCLLFCAAVLWLFAVADPALALVACGVAFFTLHMSKRPEKQS